VEDEHGVPHVVGNEQLVASRMKGESGRPIHLRPGTLDNAQRRRVPGGIPPVNRNRWWPHLPGTRKGYLQRPIRLEQFGIGVREKLVERTVVRYKHQIVL